MVARCRPTTADQCRKWRVPVTSIAAPAASTAASTSASRIEPPGWTIAVTPASSSRRGPSANGKKAWRAADAALGRAAPPPPPLELPRLVDGPQARAHPAPLPRAEPDEHPVADEQDRVRHDAAA